MISPQPAWSDGPAGAVWASNAGPPGTPGPPPNPFHQPQGGWQPQQPIGQPPGWSAEQPPQPTPPPNGGSGPSTGLLLGIIAVLAIALVAGALWVFLGDDDAVQVGAAEDEIVEVPDVVGEDVDDAVDELEDLGLRVRVREDDDEGEPGVVHRQDPEEGEEVEEGDRVTVFVGEEAAEDDADDSVDEEAAEADEETADSGFVPPEPPEPPPAAPPITIPDDFMDGMSMPESMPEASTQEEGSFDASAAHADVLASTTLLSTLQVADVELAAQSTCAWLAASPNRGFEEFITYDAAALVFVIQPEGQTVTHDDIVAFLEATLSETGDVYDPGMYDGVLAFAFHAGATMTDEVPEDAVIELLISHFLVVQHACPDLAVQFETS